MTLLPKEERRRRLVDHMVKRFTVAEWKVLLAFAYHGSLTMYRIKTDYDLVYPTVHRVVKGFERAAWIEKSGTTTSSKGAPSSLYHLTQEGLLWLLSKIPSGYAFSFDSLDEEMQRDLKADPSSVDDYSISSGFVRELKKARSYEHIYKHLMKFEFYVPRVAKSNHTLFPTVFERWDKMKIPARKYLSWVICSVSPSTLLQYYHTHGGLMERFKTLDRVFAYSAYKQYLQSAANVNTDYGPKFHWQIWDSIEDCVKSNPDLREIYDAICKELETETSGRLSFVKQFRLELSRV